MDAKLKAAMEEDLDQRKENGFKREKNSKARLAA